MSETDNTESENGSGIPEEEQAVEEVEEVAYVEEGPDAVENAAEAEIAASTLESLNGAEEIRVAGETGLPATGPPPKKRGRPPGSGNKRKLLNGVTGGAVEKKARGRPRKNSSESGMLASLTKSAGLGGSMGLGRGMRPGACGGDAAGPSGGDCSLEALLNTAQAARMPMRQRAAGGGGGGRKPAAGRGGEDISVVLFNGGLSMEDFKDLLPAVQIEILKTQRFSQSMVVVSQAYKSLDGSP